LEFAHHLPGSVVGGEDVLTFVMVVPATTGVVVVLIGDPSRFETRTLGTAMVAAWCAGLGVLLLGVVRRHNSRFTLRTLCILAALIAVYLGLCQAVQPVIPTMIVAAGLSIAMLYEVQRIGTEAQPYRGRLSRVIMAVGGLIFLAHAVRVLGFF